MNCLLNDYYDTLLKVQKLFKKYHILWKLVKLVLDPFLYKKWYLIKLPIGISNIQIHTKMHQFRLKFMSISLIKSTQVITGKFYPCYICKYVYRFLNMYVQVIILVYPFLDIHVSVWRYLWLGIMCSEPHIPSLVWSEWIIWTWTLRESKNYLK